MKRGNWFLLVVIFMVQTAASQQRIAGPGAVKLLTGARLDSIVNKLMDTAGVTGLAIGIINNSKVDYVKSYGYKNKRLNQFADTTTSFYAASFSKPLFALIVMQLVDQGIIDLDKPIYQYLPKPLPEYENYKDLAGDDRWKLITARHCLDHTTGFPNWRQLNPKGTGKLEIFFKPGTRYAYSGEGLYLLQLVVETVTHQGLETLGREQVFKPFGMTKTSYVWQKSFDANYAVGHDTDEDTFAVKRRKGANAAGSMQTTIADYTRFVAYFMQGKGISEKSKEQMLSPQIQIFTRQEFPSLNNDTAGRDHTLQLYYGLGWGLFKTAYGWAFFKEGHSEDGWQHYTIGFPGQKNALVIMTNSLNGESIFKELVERITAVNIPWEWEGYTPYLPTVKLSPEILAQFPGNYEGKLKASVSLENGQLKVEAPAEGLKKTKLYASSETRFFLKSMAVNIEFVKGPDGRIQKMLVNDEGENYELEKVRDTVDRKNFPETKGAEWKPSKEILSPYVGKYQLADDPAKVIVIRFEKDHLVARLLGQDDVGMIFSANTKFKFKAVTDISGELLLENGKVTKLIVEQNGKYEWKKVN